MSSLSQAIVERVKEVAYHPDADFLGIIYSDGFPVVVKKDEWAAGDLYVHIKPDSMVDFLLPEFEFLNDPKSLSTGSYVRIKPKKLRGIISYGLLIKCRPEWIEGQDVTDILNIKPYEAPSAYTGNLCISTKGPEGEVKYTDIESLRKYHKVLVHNERVVISEKLDGANFRAIYQNGRLFVGSHNQWLEYHDCPPWRLAEQYDLEGILKYMPDLIIFGEQFGWTQTLRYGHSQGNNSLRIFDIFDVRNGRYLSYCDLDNHKDSVGPMLQLLDHGIQHVPILYSGEWKGYEHHKELAEGNSILANHIREGFVVKPYVERYDDRVGRVILKLHSTSFLNR